MRKAMAGPRPAFALLRSLGRCLCRGSVYREFVAGVTAERGEARRLAEQLEARLWGGET
jgi:hypothetical protein